MSGSGGGVGWVQTPPEHPKGDTVQTTLLGLAIAFIIALAAALVGPYFIDWNQFRPQFEAEATRIIGAPVRATELTINGLSLDLGLDPKGRIDWPASTGTFNLGSLAIDRLNLTGRIALHDAASRGTLELSEIAFSGDVRSLAGSVRGDGSFLLSGKRYPFRVSSGQSADASGTRVHLNIDPSERALSADLDGVLSFEARAPRFEGAVMLAAPHGAKPRGGGDASQTPWRISARIKADPSAARLEQLEASYGSEETALKFAGIADIRFGGSPLLHSG